MIIAGFVLLFDHFHTNYLFKPFFFQLELYIIFSFLFCFLFFYNSTNKQTHIWLHRNKNNYNSHLIYFKLFSLVFSVVISFFLSIFVDYVEFFAQTFFLRLQKFSVLLFFLQVLFLRSLKTFFGVARFSKSRNYTNRKSNLDIIFVFLSESLSSFLFYFSSFVCVFRSVNFFFFWFSTHIIFLYPFIIVYVIVVCVVLCERTKTQKTTK